MKTAMRTAPPRRLRRPQGTYRRRSWLRTIFDVVLHFLCGMASAAAMLALLYGIYAWKVA